MLVRVFLLRVSAPEQPSALKKMRTRKIPRKKREKGHIVLAVKHVSKQ